jgi:DNA repair exonuclease SbcCD nuclease subunit
MRVLHLADTHLGAWLRVHGAPEGWSRAAEHAEAFERALEPALRGEVELVLHAGDLFDTRTPSRKLVAWTAALLGRVAARVPVLLIPGNHDPASLLRVFRMPPPGVSLADVAQRHVFGELAVAAVPFQRTVAGFEAAAARAVGPGADVLLNHQAVSGCRVPRFVFRVGKPTGTVGSEHLPAGPRWGLGGHLHPRQAVRLDAFTQVYPGATVRTAPLEGPAPKGYALWDFGREVRWRWVDLPERPYVTVREPEDLDAIQPGWLVRVIDRERYREMFHAARERGAWLVGRGAQEPAPPRRPERAQQRLFEG